MAKLNQIEVNGTTYDLQDKSIFTGTQSEVNSAISNGTIKEGDIVNITDDVSGNGGGGPVLDTIEEIMANTTSGIGAGALAVKSIATELGEDANGMTVHEKLDSILSNITQEQESTFSVVATSNYTVPESLRGRRGIAIMCFYSSSSTAPAGGNIDTSGMVVDGSGFAINNNYCKVVVYYGTFNPDQTLSCTNTSGKGDCSIYVLAV